MLNRTCICGAKVHYILYSMWAKSFSMIFLFNNNKIENIFQKVFPKHIKRTMKIGLGFLIQFVLKLNHWNIKK